MEITVKKISWLRRNVVVIGVVSLFSDLGHETGTTILPVFVATLGAAPWALAAEQHATGFGMLATVNGLGDFVSSVLVGFLWAKFFPATGFAYAAGFCLLGGLMMLRLTPSKVTKDRSYSNKNF